MFPKHPSPLSVWLHVTWGPIPFIYATSHKVEDRI